MVEFGTTAPEWQSEVKSSYDSTFSDVSTTETSIKEFFARPKRIFQITWAINSDLATTIAPLNTLAFDPRIGNKWTGYRMMRGTLCIKIQLTGSPFHYGRVLVCLTPLKAYQETVELTGEEKLTEMSQRPRIFLNPGESTGGVLKVPILWPYNGLDLTVDAQLNNAVRLEFQSMGNLKHANGGIDPVDIITWAWIEDIVLECATAKDAAHLVAQSGETEYDGPISAPASAIAAAAGKLKSIPAIAPYARATEIGARAAAKVASAFGYSKPKSTGEICAYTPRYFGNMSAVQGIDTCMSLTADPKQELTIDPRTMGLPPIDELNLNYITSKESYIGYFEWASSDNYNNQLTKLIVSPIQLKKFAIGTLSDALTLSAMSFGSLPFEYWRGSIKFRFQVVCSRFHRGKLRIVYDPLDAVTTGSADDNMVYHKVIDITSEQDAEIEVGWGSNRPWLKVEGPDVNDAMDRLADFDPVYHNGTLRVFVLNELRTVDSTVDIIRINVFASAGDDFELAVPTVHQIKNLSYFPDDNIVLREASELKPQSGELEITANDVPENDQVDDMIANELQVPAVHHVFFGDPIKSFRSLLHRYCFVDAVGFTYGAESNISLRCPHRPFHRGFDPNGRQLAVGGLPYNYTSQNYVSYILPAYALYRGAMRWKVHFQSLNSATGFPLFSNSPMMVKMDGDSSLTPKWSINAQSQVEPAWANRDAGGAGMLATSVGTNAVLEYEVPYFSNQRFTLPRVLNIGMITGTSGKTVFNETERSHKIEVEGRHGRFHRYCAAGEDIMCAMFLGAPPMFNYVNPSVS